jgi:hypothetical protein
LELADKSVHFPPQATSFAVESGAFAGAADVLAREPSANNFNCPAISEYLFTCHAPYVAVLLRGREVISEHLFAVRLYFDLGDHVEARHLETEIETAHACK